MTIRIFCCCIALFLICPYNYAQPVSHNDSVLHYENQFRYHLNKTANYDSALYYCNKGILITQNQPIGQSQFLRFKAVYFDYIANYDSCQFYLKAAAQYPLAKKNNSMLGKIYNDWGCHYLFRGMQDSATWFYILADEHIAKTEDRALSGAINNNLGLIKMKQNDYTVAKEYFYSALDHYKQVEDKETAISKTINTYINLTNCYRKLEVPEQALPFADRVLYYALSQEDTLLLSDALSSKGLILYEMNRYRESLEHSLNGYHMLKNLEVTNRTTVSLLYNIVLAYRELELYDSSIYYNKIGLELSLANYGPKEIGSFHENLQSTYELAGDYEKAYAELKSYMEYWDQNNDMRKYAIIEELEQKYRAEKKAQEILVLKQEAEIRNLYILFLIIFLLLGAILLKVVLRRRKVKHELEIAQQKDKIAQAALIGQEDERKRLSIELHDAIGASLANISLRLNNYLNNDKALPKQLEELQTQIDITCKEVRVISHNLSPYKIEQEGLATCILDFVESLNQAKKTQFKAAINLFESEIPVLTQSFIFRIIQELTNNILKHANAKNGQLNIEQVANNIILQISDNGCGFDYTSKAEGIGLKNVKNRIAYLNGNLEIVSEPAYGTLFTIEIPLQ